MSDIEKRIAIIQGLGHTKTGDRAYSIEFRTSKGEFFYLQKTKKISLVFDPLRLRKGAVISGVVGRERFNSNFDKFEKKQNTGIAPEKHGIAFDAKDDSHMKQIIAEAVGV